MRCQKCKIHMTEGRALKNTLHYSADFIGDDNSPMRGKTVSRTGKVVLVDVNKCPQCGYSVEK